MTSILTYGAKGDGSFDCSPAIQAALKNEKHILFPAGIYCITETMRIPSGRHITLEEGAVIYAADGCFNRAGVRAIITNDDYENGNADIVIEGGKIDANNLGNARESWINGPSSGLTFCFQNVKGLTVRNMAIHNSESYNMRLTRTEDFLIEDMVFTATNLTNCQDGIHVNGFCHRGVIRNIHAEGQCTNDDLIAFNADDVNFYSNNWGQEDGPISDMLVENVFANDCHTALRMLSVRSEIKNVTIRNLRAGVRCHALNFDVARYCAHPMFTDAENPNGVGNLKNILLEDITIWKTSQRKFDFIPLETKGELTIKNFHRDMTRDQQPEIPTVKVKSLPNAHVTVNGEAYVSAGETRYFEGDRFDIKIR